MYRYALYYAPAPDSPLWAAGSRWLGRDAAHLATLAQPDFPCVPAPVFRALTEKARHYGFHATLKSPFRLRPGQDETALREQAAAFARRQQPLVLRDMQVRLLHGFLALRPAGPQAALQALALDCVRHFEAWRAPLTEAELERRRSVRLSPRQEALLLHWGYPYTEEEFRFHMTLSSTLTTLEADNAAALHRAAAGFFAPALEAGPVVIDGIALFAQAGPQAPFTILQRFPFTARARPGAGKECGKHAR